MDPNYNNTCPYLNSACGACGAVAAENGCTGVSKNERNTLKLFEKFQMRLGDWPFKTAKLQEKYEYILDLGV